MLIILFTFGLNDFSHAESKIATKVFGSKDCSQYSTKNFADLGQYVRCKKGLPPLKKNFLKSLEWKEIS